MPAVEYGSRTTSGKDLAHVLRVTASWSAAHQYDDERGPGGDPVDGRRRPSASCAERGRQRAMERGGAGRLIAPLDVRVEAEVRPQTMLEGAWRAFVTPNDRGAWLGDNLKLDLDELR